MIKLMSHFCDPEATERIIVKTVKNSIGISFGLVRAGAMTNFLLDLIGKPLFSGKLQKVPVCCVLVPCSPDLPAKCIRTCND